MPDLTPVQWLLAGIAAFIMGVSKTCLPGAGTLGVPLLAIAVGGRQSVGVMLPLLVCGDLFALAWYRRHARWDLLLGLAKWVLIGVALGGLTLYWSGKSGSATNLSNLIIGGLVLVMLGVHLGRQRWGDLLVPSRPLFRRATGAAAGFATTVSNAAGPVTSLYLASAQIGRNEFLGTSAWFYFVFNLTKVPLFFALGMAEPQAPLINSHSLILDLWLLPAMVLGAVGGRWLLKAISERLFEDLVLWLAAIASCKLVYDGVSALVG